MLSDNELLRYNRHIMLPEIDIEGQEKLSAATVLIVGLGGLGCPVAMYLAAAGVGHLLLADFDKVDLSNLQRQIAHTTERIGHSKVGSAAQTIASLNPGVKVQTIERRLEGLELIEEVGKVTLVVDCSDRFSTRFALNKACVQTKTPLVLGAAIQMEGQVAVFDASQPNTACYQCLYKEGDDRQLSCAEAGVLAPLVGVIGSMQALEAIKLLVGFGENLLGRVLLLDAKYMHWRSLTLSPDPQCPACGAKTT